MKESRMSNHDLFAVIARTDHAVLRLEQARRGVETARSALEIARSADTQARAELEEVLTLGEASGISRKVLKQAAEARLSALLELGIPVLDGVEAPREPELGVAESAVKRTSADVARKPRVRAGKPQDEATPSSPPQGQRDDDAVAEPATDAQASVTPELTEAPKLTELDAGQASRAPLHDGQVIPVADASEGTADVAELAEEPGQSIVVHGVLVEDGAEASLPECAVAAAVVPATEVSLQQSPQADTPSTQRSSFGLPAFMRK
jgi:hypothetical protein